MVKQKKKNQPHYETFSEALEELKVTVDSLSSMTPDEQEAALKQMTALANKGAEALEKFSRSDEAEAPPSAMPNKGKK